ncbi:polysaccharide deacetylase family protein [Nocardia sp. NBC_01329]|uniref:polysaccharide deacetylase family protein n=1 Tax=Nocardia sp. NBC_01329 TaxID=2903594 RepID=UPI002E0F53E3|nr:polysaccharide deacetylase family protein [Nocardia sp. NBC_01329]
MRKRVAGSAIALVAVLIVAAGGYFLMNSRTYQLAGRLVDRVDTDEKVVALTLDDGPSEHAPEVLGSLATAGIPATFYLNGRDLTARPDLGRAVVQAGHEIGNHTYNHRRMVFVSPETVAEEVEDTDSEIRAAGYQGDITFRPPYGKKLWALPKYLADHDRTTVTWDVEPEDGNTTTAAMVAAAVDQVRPGSIILLHTMYASGAASRAAIGPIAAKLHAQGYRFVTISELLDRGDSTRP